ncbi:hypothetical protein BVRB_7g180510 [Beta vulgaris subsp. vulgaris]|uniref:Uncharacterized protein n=1 Tax=Beta vulgaris subsp. vulgaris TaxID=3555 RepID=A0A0J8B7C6_BETVV|nr:hypothetical protein BVRB_7g180510 [Beta vulgaris subsp. vulgaris]
MARRGVSVITYKILTLSIGRSYSFLLTICSSLIISI